MQNFRENTDSHNAYSINKTVAAMVSATIAALIFFGAYLSTENCERIDQLTVAEAIRASGDTLTASVDSSKVYKKDEAKDEEQKPKKKIIKPTLNDERRKKMDKRDKEWVEDADYGSKRELKMIKKTSDVKFEVEERKSTLLAPGKKRVIQEGQKGEKTYTYRQRIENGEVISEKLYNEEITKKPVSEIVLVGVKGEDGTISPLDFEIELDENGVPTEYEQVLSNQVATGYHLGTKATGASGQKLSAGYVAVHPGEIPYGTKMYITSEDNSFVYGFAVAADTGLGLMQDIIDVDLYYDTYIESCLNGRKNVNIYIL